MKNPQLNMLEKYEKWFLELRKGVYFGRLGKTFCTDDNFYFFDTGTGKIAEIREEVYQILTCLFENDAFEPVLELGLTEDELIEGFEEINLAVDSENILSAPVMKTMVNKGTLDLEDSLLKNSNTIVLELTEDCNLRCTYCIYHPKHPGYREFGKKHMSSETAKQSVDFLLAHSSSESEHIHIGFYGGEPFLNFAVMKDTIEYAKEKFSSQKLSFGVTTNAVLLTSSTSDYLIENNVAIVVSLDRPKEIHDKQRLFIDDSGSFDAVEKGIKQLIKSCEKYNKNPDFTVNMVIDDYDKFETYELIQDFYDSCEWLPKKISIRCSGIGIGPRVAPLLLPHSKEEKNLLDKLEDPIETWTEKRTDDYLDNVKVFSKETIDESLIRIHKRFLSNTPTSTYPMNGCCVPGNRKAYITTSGEIYPCEQLGGQVPSLGNVTDGYDVTKIRKYYIDDYIEKSKEDCQKCWAINLCGVCYSECYDAEGLKPEFKNMLCILMRGRLENSLIRYHKLFENNSAILEEYNSMEIS